ncbi:major Facilitator Superfamily protein [Brevibacillus laterosporus GI-9]|uniref:MDR family MFS transporter n=1 Tax=Brevibacillus laterosporus TaxID=1465 RepID=UPI0002404585|nr:MFS transporter [Brevibacillus laterosporus]CCF12752.1 major Facilitator Superfamily protein [Brevibacillus laterosporus GI-9]
MLSKMLSTYPRTLWILAIGAIINVTGMSFIWPLNNIYITQILGKPATVAGLVLMLHAGMGIIGSMAGGILHDKIGGIKTIFAGVLISAACVTSLAFFRVWPFYVCMMGILGFSNSMVFPVLNAMAGSIWPEGGRRAFNLLYLSQNLGVAVGSALGGVVASVSFMFVFLVNGATNLIFLAVIGFGLDLKKIAAETAARNLQRKTEKATNKASNNETFIWKTPSGLSLLILCLGFAITWIPYVQWSTNLSSYMTKLGYSLSQYSLLWTINGALIILAQPLCAYVTRHYLSNLRSQMIGGLFIFVCGMGVLAFDQAYSHFVCGMIIVTLGEMLLWPAVPAAAAELSITGKEGLFQGAVSGAATAGRMIGPFIGGLLYESFSPVFMLYVMIAICVLPLLCYVCYDRPLYGSLRNRI